MKRIPLISYAIRQPVLYMLTILYLLLATTAVQGQENLSAFVDRTEVSVNDVLTLTIRVGANLGAGRPSLEVLENDFELLGTTTSSSFSNINGNVQSWTEYRISLKPEHIGTLTIPAFRIGNETTQPITVNVSERAQISGSSDNDIFMDTSVSKSELYVQEQLVFTIRLYYSLRFNQGAQLSTPQVENSVVQQLGSDQNYQEIVDGIRYDVTERRYAIFPQSSGELVIPPIYFSATVGGRNGLNRLLNRSSPTRQINLSSETHHLTVMPIPDTFTGHTWLPASNLELQETWTNGGDSIQVGDSLTREVRLLVSGLNSSLLPDIKHPAVDGIRFYSDQPKREDSVDRSGVISSRTESVAIVPAKAGTFELPEITINWWNTEEDREEVARVASRSITVSSPAAASDIVMDPLPITETSSTNPGSTQTPTVVVASNTTPWIIATALLALALILSTFLWLRARTTQMVGAPTGTRTGSETMSLKAPNLDKAFKYFVKSCQKGSPEDTRHAIIQWGQAFYDKPTIHTLAQLKAHIQNPAVETLLTQLESTLYGAEGNAEQFDSMQLLKEISAIHKQGREQQRAYSDNTLPPLYRN